MGECENSLNQPFHGLSSARLENGSEAKMNGNVIEIATKT